MLAMIPLTIHVSDTYFIVAHIHYVLFGGSLFTIFAGVYYWFPKMTGRMYDERLGKLHFWMTFIFFNVTFAPMHLIGVQGMPRRVADYAEQFADWNLVISIVSFFLGLSALVFAYNMIASWRGGPRARANPWRALTLEWQVSSPPPIFNFDAIPTVVGGPYEYGVPGAVHGVLKGAEVAQPAGATASGAGHGSGSLVADKDEGVAAMPSTSSSSPTRRSAAPRCSSLVEERAQGARHELHARRADDAPALGLRHLRRRRARRRAGAPRPRALLPARRGRRRQRRGRRRGSVHGDDRRDRRVPARRDHHLDAARRRPRAGCGATSSSASRTRPACPSRTSSPTWTPRACRSRSRSSSPTGPPAAATLRAPLKENAAEAEDSSSSSSSRWRRTATAAPPRSPARAWATRWTRCAARGCSSPA